jgi:hypothetical protein
MREEGLINSSLARICALRKPTRWVSLADLCFNDTKGSAIECVRYCKKEVTTGSMALKHKSAE